ncbi:MAG: protein kinase domain-containing protein [Pirellulaceae bacterium]
MSTPSTLEAIFFAALEKGSPAERAAYLDEACADDHGLRGRVERMLAAQVKAGSFLEVTAEEVNRTVDQPVTEKVGTQIGPYKLLQEIGQGGMGIVYMAEQHEPVRRRVALKIIKPGMDTRQVIARFDAERQAVAMMDHPNIAKVLDVGATESGRPFFAMELVRGLPINRFCDQHLLTVHERLQLIITVCHAVQHAHQKGIIHRDIKPTNILITLHDGRPVAKVIDFGVAKATGQRLTERTLFTAVAQMIGTPLYMSPEQAEMGGLDIDTRTDIYSLGVTLYELLTGTTPFDESRLRQVTYDDFRRIICHEDPPKPSTRISTLGQAGTNIFKQRRSEPVVLQRLMRSDLDWIVMKCLEKDRTRRYETANDLAADLRRYLDNEPIVARPPSTAYRLQKAWRRNKLAYTAASAVFVALLVGMGVSMWQTGRALRAEREQSRLRNVAVNALSGETKQRAQAEVERRRAEDRELEARRRAYASDMNVAKQALDNNNFGHALEMLDRQRPTPGEEDLRAWEWRYLWDQTRSDALCTLCRESNEIRSLSVSSDGELMATTVHGRGGLSLWNIAARREMFRLASTEQNVSAVFSPTDPLLAFTGVSLDTSGDLRASLRLLNHATRNVIRDTPLDGECVGLAISKDGQMLATITWGDRTTYRVGGHITLWRLPEVTPTASYPCEPAHGARASFAVTPDLSQAAYVSSGQVRIIDLQNGQELRRIAADVKSLAFSPDGKLLAAGVGTGIVLWDAATGKEIGQLAGHQSWIMSLLFFSDRMKLASGSADQTIRIWDVPSRTCVDTLRGHRQQVWELALLRNDQTLVSGCRDGAVCLWDTAVSHSRHRLIEIPDSALAWAFEADSQSIVTVNELGRVTRWRGASFEVPETLLETGETPQPFSWCFSRSGRRLARGSADGIVRVWDLPSRKLWREFTNVPGQARRLMADGNRLLILSVEDFVVHDVNLITGAEIQSWRAPADIIHFAISPDERHCVTLGYAGDAVLTDLKDMTTTKSTLAIRESHDGDYSPDGRLLAVPSSLGFVQIWNAQTWAEEKKLSGFFDEVFGSVFLANGNRLAVTAGAKEAIRLYDTSTWLETLTLDDEEGHLWPTMVSPDGNIIGATTLFRGWRLRLWRAPSWKEIVAAEASEEAASRQR